MEQSKHTKLPEGWVTTSINEIVHFKKGKKPNHIDTVSFKNSVPYLDIKAFEYKIVERYADSESAVIVDESDIVMVWDGAKSGWVSEGMKGALGSTLALLKPFIISPKYLYYYLNSQFTFINFNAKGTGIPHVDPFVLWGLQLPLPPLQEQYRIVPKIESLFSELDQAEKGLKTAQQQLEVYRQALLKSAFEGKLTGKWYQENKPEHAQNLLKEIRAMRKKRFDQEYINWKASVKEWEKEKQGKKPTKPKAVLIPDNPLEAQLINLPKLRKGGMWSKVGIVAHIEMGQSPSGESYNEQGIGIPLINGPAEFGKTPFSKTLMVKWTTKPTKVCLKGDLILCVRGSTTGRQNISGFQACIGRGVCSIRSVEIYQPYLNYFFYFSKNKILEMGTGTTFPSISKEQIEEFLIPIFSKIEQQEIVKLLESRFTIIDNLSKSITYSLRDVLSFKQSVLKKAFEGKLIAQYSTDEPANLLLQKIRIEKSEYLKTQKDLDKLKPQKKRLMDEKKTVLEILKESKEPISTQELWTNSIHEGDIESFYSEIKEIFDQLDEIKESTESLLSLKK